MLTHPWQGLSLHNLSSNGCLHLTGFGPAGLTVLKAVDRAAGPPLVVTSAVVLEVLCHRWPLIQGEYLGNPADNLHGNNHIGFMFQQIGHLTQSQRADHVWSSDFSPVAQELSILVAVLREIHIDFLSPSRCPFACGLTFPSGGG